ncbi:MAG: hypothetical protein ACRBN8_17030 [Nannocystales bacterium]
MRVKCVLLGLIVVAGCHHRLPRLSAQGKHAEVVERVEHARFRPKKKAARAYAASLHAMGRSTQALDALLLDYRRGGEVASLVALADLERTLGWRGLAAHHYARALTHDRNVLNGRGEVCGLFRERARAYLHAHEGEAADLDMRRVLALCGSEEPGDAELAASADTAAQLLVDARIESGSCPPPCTAAERHEALAPALKAARASSPRAVAELAATLGRELPAEVVVELLEAEARGALGVALLQDDTVRDWVGAKSWSDLAPTVMSAPGPLAAYAQLRLSSVVGDMPQAEGRSGTRERDRWAEQALRVPDVAGWRIYAAQGDIATAELTFASRWRPASVTALPADGDAPRVEHWSQRLAIGEGTLEVALIAARLRAAAGKHDLALRLTHQALEQGKGVSNADRLARDLAVEAIGWGRPWHALAVLDTGAVEEPASLRAAAATSIVLGRAMCDGSCREDEDLGVVTRVMGEAWVDTSRNALLGWSLARRTRPAPTGGCPTVAELTEPDAVGPLADAIRAAQDELRGPGVGETLSAAIASDLRSWCAASIVLPAMVTGEHRLPAERLSDALSHVPEMNASADLVTHAKLALVAGQSARAVLLAVAAAGQAAVPREVWLEMAEFSALAADRELELRSLREALLVTPGLHDPILRRRMLLVALRDVDVSWGQDLVGGKGATAGHVADYLDPLPRPQRWREEQALLRAVEAEGFVGSLEPEARELLIVALGGEAALSLRHPRALARLRGETAAPPVGPLDDAGMADAAAAGRLLQIPAPAGTLADPRSFERTRMALATSARDWSVRRKMAISLLVLGSAQARRVGWSQLAQMAGESKTAQLDALRDLVVQRPAGLVPMWGRWAPVTPRAVLEGQDNLVRVVLGLDLEPSLVAP